MEFKLNPLVLFLISLDQNWFWPITWLQHSILQSHGIHLQPHPIPGLRPFGPRSRDVRTSIQPAPTVATHSRTKHVLMLDTQKEQKINMINSRPRLVARRSLPRWSCGSTKPAVLFFLAISTMRNNRSILFTNQTVSSGTTDVSVEGVRNQAGP